MFQVINQAFSSTVFFDTMFSSVITLYGMAFVFNLPCILIIYKKFFPLYNIRSGNNYVMSSSSYFSDNKGTLPLRVWLMLLIPFFYVYFILYYAYQLKKFYPETGRLIPAYWILSLGVTSVCTVGGFILQLYYKCSIILFDAGTITYSPDSLYFIPFVIILLCNLVCYVMHLISIRKYFIMPEVVDDEI